jgi:5-methylcytosine-specific restriction endonuclease McrBC regulatory subunit McrC
MLELREYETRTVPLTIQERTELAGLTRASLAESDAPRVIQQLTPSATAQCFDVQPGPYVGRFTLNSGLTVDIASRFPFADLLEMLRVATRQPTLLRPTPAPMRGGHGLLELIATAFIREVERVVGLGLAKGYQMRTFTRPPYPGVPDAIAHLSRHLGRPDRLVTRARRLTSDIPVNQALAAAHRVLSHQPYADPMIGVHLRALAPIFTQITPVAQPGRVADAASRNVANRYREALGLAVLVLAGQTTLPAGACAAGVSVLFNMAKVWENYIQKRLQEQLPPGHHLVAQHPILLTDDESRMTANADLVQLDQHGNHVAVFDAKYKLWDKTPTTGDLYQIFTYAQRLGLNRASLLYPGRGEHSEVSIGRCRISMIGIDVLGTSASSPGKVAATPVLVSSSAAKASA